VMSLEQEKKSPWFWSPE